ncbi:hypothetical protein DLAC_03516 [Tieghemostelium lacteum]|uniref:Uncharacterized protein n=1 Tax=Tieghemostelium lacteum TaxID=361077 RepID=A0A152A1E4_TIELA|nr:hypothetical protein DLAC_03516 [Tieghemostelium lacteum]|eukprot:KYR00019.1 hypothetical protein DLAC_03516 [Tieghemostelium lacteum]
MKSIIIIYIFLFIGCYICCIPTTTNWNSISPNILTSFASDLPVPPSSVLPINVSGIEENPFSIWTLGVGNVPSNNCMLPTPSGYTFPQYGVEYGSNADAGTCRTTVDGSQIVLGNKRAFGNSIPISADPSWAMFRFPLPDRSKFGDPQKITITFDGRGGETYGITTKGGNPCQSGPSPACNIRIEGTWDRAVVPGFYVLLGTPGIGGWEILGPYNDNVWPKLEIALTDDFKGQNIQEIDVVIFAFNQYPYVAECPGNLNNCYMYVHKHLRINTVQLTNGLVFQYSKTPSVYHPRIWGNNQEFWTQRIEPYWNLACDNLAPGGYSLQNIRKVWENILFDGSLCDNTRKTPMTSNLIWKKYLDSAVTWGNDRAKTGKNAMFLVRFLKSCLSLGRSDCVYTQAELDAFIPKVIDQEFKYFSNWGNWYDDATYKIDLGSAAPTEFWSLFYDTFYDHMNVSVRTTIESKIDAQMANYRNVFAQRAWTLWNGNNWTPWISSGFVFASLSRWYENTSLSQGMMTDLLSVMYRSRYLITNDGTFIEGLANYASMAMDKTMVVESAIYQTLGIHLQSPNWAFFEESYKWINDFVFVDGHTIDFGDSHIAPYSSITPLFSMYVRDMIGYGGGSPVVDPCQVNKFWANHYLQGGLETGFEMYSIFAKNWTALTSACTSYQDISRVYPYGGSGFFARKTLNSPSVAINSRNKLADYTGIAIQAKSSMYPHAELDFGGVIWAAFGSRILVDLSYGTISKENKADQLDNGPAGTNTVVIEEAWNSTFPGIINYSQFYNIKGTISLNSKTSDGVTYPFTFSDGSALYGRGLTTGWLNRYYRYVIPIPSDNGAYVILDTLTKHPSRSSVSPSEYFYSSNSNVSPLPSCGLWIRHSVMSLISGEVNIAPLCNTLSGQSTTVNGRITGASILGSTSFVYDGAITYSSVSDTNAAYRSRYVTSTPITQPEARAFLLLASQTSTFTTHSVTKYTQGPCTGNVACFEVILGTRSWRIELIKDSDIDGYSFSCIKEKSVSGYSTTSCQ